MRCSTQLYIWGLSGGRTQSVTFIEVKSERVPKCQRRPNGWFPLGVLSNAHFSRGMTSTPKQRILLPWKIVFESFHVLSGSPSARHPSPILTEALTSGVVLGEPILCDSSAKSSAWGFGHIRQTSTWFRLSAFVSACETVCVCICMCA